MLRMKIEIDESALLAEARKCAFRSAISNAAHLKGVFHAPDGLGVPRLLPIMP